MKKQLSTEKSISLRIILLAPPSGVDFGIQEGKGSNYKTIQVQRSEDSDVGERLKAFRRSLTSNLTRRI